MAETGGILGGWPLWLTDPIAERMLTVGATPVGLAATDFADQVVAQVIDNPVRLTLAGGAPSPTFGMRFGAGDVISIGGRPSIMAVQLVREGTTDATLYVVEFRLDVVRLVDLVTRGSLPAAVVPTPEGG